MGRKKRICPLCKCSIGIDVYIYDAGGVWYHYFCGNKALEKKGNLTKKGKNIRKKNAKTREKMLK